MNSIVIIISIVCLLFFVSGCLLGSAMVSSKLNELRNRFKKMRTESDQLSEECSWLKKTHDEVLADYKNLYTYYNEIRKQCASQQNLIQQLKKDISQVRQNRHEKIQESQGTEYANQIISLQQKVSELQKYQPFYQKYLDQISKENDLRFQLQQLKEEISRLNGIIQKGTIVQKRLPINATVYEKSANVSGIFDSLIGLLTNQIFEHGCVISDDMGFVVASSCDFSDELAGTSVLFQQCEKLIRRNSKFNTLARLCFVSENNLHLTIFPLTVDNLNVYCCGLSKKPFPQESNLNTIVLPLSTSQTQRNV